MTLPLSSLLYYNLSTIKHGELKKGFREYRLLLSALIESVEAFEAGDLEKFDSLVGENACQIRAIRIALIHASNSLNIDIKYDAIRIRDEISDLMDKKINSLSSGKLSLREIFENHDFEIFLTEEEIFALKSFILSEAKETIGIEKSDSLLSAKLKCTPNKIQRFGSDVSNHFLGRLANHLRQLLSRSSVQFVQQSAFNLQENDLVEMLSDDRLYHHNTLACLPMFWTYKALLKVAKKNDLPLIVRVKLIKKHEETHVVVDERSYFFKPMLDFLGNWQYQATTPAEEDLTRAACVIEGVADCSRSNSWDENLLTRSVVSAILAGAADHRQYPNLNPSFRTNNLEYFYFKSLARDYGFSLQNPTCFFIQHVYASEVNKLFVSQKHNSFSLLSNSNVYATA